MQCAAGGKATPPGTRLILSHHDYEGTPDMEALRGVLARMLDAGADVPKIACVANDVADSARMLQLAASSACARRLTLKLGGRAVVEWGGFATWAFLPCEQRAQALSFCVLRILLFRLMAHEAAAADALAARGMGSAHDRAVHGRARAALPAAGAQVWRRADVRRAERGPRERARAADRGAAAAAVPAAAPAAQHPGARMRMPRTRSTALQPPGRLRRADGACPSCT